MDPLAFVHPHVMDDILKVQLPGKGDYTERLQEWATRDDIAGVLVYEWDVAVGLDDHQALLACIDEEPDLVHLIPYKLYPASTGHEIPLSLPGRTEAEIAIHSGFGFGCTYLPVSALREYVQWGPQRQAERWGVDTLFSEWYLGRAKPCVHWEAHSVHLNS